MQMQSTYWLEKVLKMISLYVNALLCALQHIVIHAMQLTGRATQRCQFSELTPLSCIACMTICCSVHKREGAEIDLLLRQCTFVHAAACCHKRDATHR